ncbi:MAG: hypothetical protein OD815_001710 [Candidatus Alkanophagales archaeon MCA70_species_2]|nr:hypothetical protein [Candidatus Alkanophaga liquidiphilum]
MNHRVILTVPVQQDHTYAVHVSNVYRHHHPSAINDAAVLRRWRRQELHNWTPYVLYELKSAVGLILSAEPPGVCGICSYKIRVRSAQARGIPKGAPSAVCGIALYERSGTYLRPVHTVNGPEEGHAFDADVVSSSG